MYAPFTKDQPDANPRGEIVQLASGSESKLSLNKSEPTCMETGTVTGLFVSSLEEIVTVSLKVPVPVVVVDGVTVIVAGALPEVTLRPSHDEVSLAVQLRLPVPAFAI